MKEVIEKEDGLCQDYLDDDVSYLIVQRVGSINFYVCEFLIYDL